LQVLGEEVGVVDDLAFEEPVELSESMRWDLSTLPLSRGVRGLMRDVVDPTWLSCWTG
jgi:hypothetical protein